MFYDRFAKLCKSKGVSDNKACIAIGVNRSAVAKWKQGGTPNGTTLSKMADYFGVTVDYLLNGEQKENPVAKSDEVTFDDFTYALHNQSKDLNDANKEKLLDMARMLKLAQDAQKNK